MMRVVNSFQLTLVFSLIVLVGIQTVLIQSGYAWHIPMKKFTVFDTHLSEMKGTVVEANRVIDASRNINSTDLFIIPDPSYRSMLLESNFKPLSKPIGIIGIDPAYEGWKRMQDVGKSCNLPAELYPQPFPIIKMEKYGYDMFKDAPFKELPQAPNVTEPAYAPPDIKQYHRPVKLCDHVKVSGYYVLDNAHWMYSQDRCWPGPDVKVEAHVLRPFEIDLKTCKPHAEFHPYMPDSKWNLIQLLEPPRWDLKTVEEHVLAVPFYSLYFDSTFVEDSAGVKRRPVDFTKINSAGADWFISAPPKPPECSGRMGCILNFTERNITNLGTVQRSIHMEPNGISVRVGVKASPDSDYTPVGNDAWLVKNPSIFRAQYRVNWIANETCVKFDPSTTRVVPHDTLPDNKNKISGFKVIAGDIVLDMTPIENDTDSDKAIAKEKMQKLVDFILQYDLNTHCFVQQKGHSSAANPSPTGQSVRYNPQHAVGYFLKDGVAPAINSTNHIIFDPRGLAFTNTCEDINSTNYRIERLDDIRGGSRWYVTGDFNLNYNYEFITYEEATKFLEAIMQYQFNKICPVGGLMKGTFVIPDIPRLPIEH